MPIIVDWYDETQNIIIKNYVDTWTLEDIAASNKTVLQIANQTSERFDIIEDLSESPYTLPIGSLHLWYEHDAELNVSFPNWKLAVFITTKPVYQAYFEAGTRKCDIQRKHYRLVKTLEEAIQLIIDDRAKAD